MYVIKYPDLPHEYKRNKKDRNHDTENIKKKNASHPVEMCLNNTMLGGAIVQ